MSLKGILKIANEIIGGEVDFDGSYFPPTRIPDDKAPNDLKKLKTKKETYDEATGMLASTTQTEPSKGMTFNKVSAGWDMFGLLSSEKDNPHKLDRRTRLARKGLQEKNTALPVKKYTETTSRVDEDPSLYTEDVDTILEQLKSRMPEELVNVNSEEGLENGLRLKTRAARVLEKIRLNTLQMLDEIASRSQQFTEENIPPVFKESSVNSMMSLFRKKAAKDDAKGLPSKKNYGDLSKLTPGQFMTLVGQRHSAKRAGEHLDLRFGNPDIGLFSWALPKGMMPEPGSRPVLAVQQPVHRYDYKDFEGSIPRGTYGGGRVKKELENEIVLTGVRPDKIDFTIGGSRGGGRYALIKTKDNDWLLINTTPTKAPIVDIHQKYKDISKEIDIEKAIQDRAVSAKIDGALALLALKQRGIEAFSPRSSKKTGLPITYTERLGIQRMPIPKELVGKVLRGEVYAQKSGRVLPPNEISGLLNMNLNQMLRRVRDEDIDFKVAPFEVVSDKRIPFAEKQKELEDIVSTLGVDKLRIPPYETDPKKAMQLIEQIRSGNHPLTSEGVVLFPLAGGIPEKYKFKQDRDVLIRKIFEAVTKGGPRRAGGFSYSFPGSDKILGRVGTGFDRDTLVDMIENPDKYIGRTARVSTPGEFPSGALKSPAFIALHHDI